MGVLDVLSQRMSAVLDKYDRKILYELDLDGRMSYTKVGKKIKKSKDFVSRRLERLRKEGILLGDVCIIDASKLGKRSYEVYLRIVNHEHIHEIIEFLKWQKDIFAIQQIMGRYQLYASLYGRTAGVVDEFLMTLDKQFPGAVVGCERVEVVSGFSLAHNYLFDKKVHHDKRIHGASEIELNSKEKLVLGILSARPRASLNEIAKEIHSEIATVRKIISGLKKKGVIMYFRPSVDATKFGFLMKHLTIKLRFSGLKESAALEKFLLSKRSVKTVFRTFGSFDFIGRFVFGNLEEFRLFEKDLFNQFGEIIEFVENHDYVSEIKYRP